MSLFIIIPAAIVTTFLLTGAILRYRLGILDIPNARSLHTQVTPKGGGVAIFLVTMGGLLIYGFVYYATISWPHLLVFMVAGALVAAISFLDDVRAMSFQLRLVIHGLAALILIFGLGYLGVIGFPWIGYLCLGWFGILLTFLWVVGLTNAYNFMDGMDGLAGSQAVIAGLGWGILGWSSGQLIVSGLGFLVAAASLGFLGYNWPPAKIFLGDVGSVFLGFSFAALPMLAVVGGESGHIGGYYWFIAGILMLWPFIFDSFVTFLQRLYKKENVFLAHQSHFYQRLILCGLSQRSVVLLYSGLAIIGTSIAFLWYFGWVGSLFVFLSILLLELGFWRFVCWHECKLHELAAARQDSSLTLR